MNSFLFRLLPACLAATFASAEMTRAEPGNAAGDPLFDKLDINDDGWLSGIELNEGWSRYDQNGDGEVGKEEFSAGYRQESTPAGRAGPAEEPAGAVEAGEAPGAAAAVAGGWMLTPPEEPGGACAIVRVVNGLGIVFVQGPAGVSIVLANDAWALPVGDTYALRLETDTGTVKEVSGQVAKANTLVIPQGADERVLQDLGAASVARISPSQGGGSIVELPLDRPAAAFDQLQECWRQSAQAPAGSALGQVLGALLPQQPSAGEHQPPKDMAALPSGQAATVRPAATQADRELLNHAYYCETSQALESLNQGANIDAINSGGWTPLMEAALNDCDALAQLLIARGANLTAKNSSGETALDVAEVNDPEIAEAIEAALGEEPGPADTDQPIEQVEAVPLPREFVEWPPLGHYKPGQPVLYRDAGSIWDEGVVDHVQPGYGYVVTGEYNSSNIPYRSGVAGLEREPFWTGWFVGTWDLSVPIGLRMDLSISDLRAAHLPPLSINPDGTYDWRVADGNGQEHVIHGRWEPNPGAPGVILKNGEYDADWLVYNSTDNVVDYDEIHLTNPKNTYYTAKRLEE